MGSGWSFNLFSTVPYKNVASMTIISWCKVISHLYWKLHGSNVVWTYPWYQKDTSKYHNRTANAIC